MIDNDPFFIEGPALVSFSGGRTSGYMLAHILERARQDGLPVGQLWPDVHVLFCNTGKEDDRTLDFVHACAQRWSVPIRWLEYRRFYLPAYKSPEVAEAARRAREAFGLVFQSLPEGVTEPGFAEVTYVTAARTSDEPSKKHPFTNLIGMSGVPNAATRLCSTEMKTRVMKKFMLAQGYREWINIVGIRGDEPKRVARMRVKPPERWENAVPLAEAEVSEREVLAFWSDQPFDLQLPHDPELGTYEGNCDFCMLKRADKKIRLARENPAALEWWLKVESATGSTFRPSMPYREVRRLAVLGNSPAHPNDVDELVGCACTD
jgi:3'-phosphoadenosine 5'-phosphosulfate sulfotransferase (PAPS reductase)/FAD synthetase